MTSNWIRFGLPITFLVILGIVIYIAHKESKKLPKEESKLLKKLKRTWNLL